MLGLLWDVGKVCGGCVLGLLLGALREGLLRCVLLLQSCCLIVNGFTLQWCLSRPCNQAVNAQTGNQVSSQYNASNHQGLQLKPSVVEYCPQSSCLRNYNPGQKLHLTWKQRLFRTLHKRFKLWRNFVTHFSTANWLGGGLSPFVERSLKSRDLSHLINSGRKGRVEDTSEDVLCSWRKSR